MSSSNQLSLRAREPPLRGIRRVSRALVRNLAVCSAALPLDERIHASRVAAKTLRAYLQLLRPIVTASALRRAERPLRKASHALSVHRDRDVAASTLAVLETRVGKRRRKLLARAAHTIDEMSRSPKRVRQKEIALDELNRALEASSEALAAFEPDKRGWDVLGAGYASTYARCQKHTLRWRASGQTEDSHRLRRHVKNLGYQLSLLESASTGEIRRDVKALRNLGHRLGRLHDCTTLVALTRSEQLKRRIPATVRAEVRRAAHAWEKDLTREGLALAEPLFVETPQEFERRIEQQWRAARPPRT